MMPFPLIFFALFVVAAEGLNSEVSAFVPRDLSKTKDEPVHQKIAGYQPKSTIDLANVSCNYQECDIKL